LLENFVVSEVLKLITWSDKRLRVSHFRTKEQDEVDLVLEDRQGRVIGIEVKASATVRAPDLRGLRQLQAAVGDKFVQGLVLHDHDRITPFDEKLHAGRCRCCGFDAAFASADCSLVRRALTTLFSGIGARVFFFRNAAHSAWRD
jgi:hypothetical protein